MLSMNHFELYSVMVITLLAVISPGPDFAMVSKLSLLQGRRAGVLCALGIGMAISVHITYTLLGLGIVLANHAWLLELLRWLGATYLIWLGASALWPDIKRLVFRLKPYSIKQESIQPYAASTPPTKEPTKRIMSNKSSAFWCGFTCNALNPKTMLFIVSLYSQVVALDAPLMLNIAYGAYIALVHFIWFALVALLLTTSHVERKAALFKQWIERVCGVVLVAFGGRLLSQ